MLDENLIENYQRAENQVGKDLLGTAKLLLIENQINRQYNFSIYRYELPEIPAGRRIDVTFVLKADEPTS